MADTWYRVDNVAKVFIATNSRRDPRVFRVSCTLNADIDGASLDEALRLTARQFPNFQVTLHRGLFWHYFESTDQIPVAKEENKEPCAPLYVPERRNQLIYRVSYFGARINLEMFHAMTDGNGGFLFLKSLVRNYLMLRHPGTLDSVPTPNSASEADLEQDSFKNFYEGTRRTSQTRPPKAYHLRGARLPYDQLQYFEGHLHVKEVLDRARTLGVSLSSYLGASLMLAIYSEMPAMERRKPISISLPVNLRNYYPSETARNFFNSVYVTHTLTDDDTLETVAPVFDAKLKEILHPEIFIKNAAVRFFTHLEDQHVTAVLSNMGRVDVAEELRPYIKQFAAFSSCEGLFTCVSSYGDDLVLGTASSLRSTNVLRRLYRGFAKEGLAVTLYATEVEK